MLGKVSYISGPQGRTNNEYFRSLRKQKKKRGFGGGWEGWPKCQGDYIYYLKDFIFPEQITLTLGNWISVRDLMVKTLDIIQGGCCHPVSQYVSSLVVNVLKALMPFSGRFFQLWTTIAKTSWLLISFHRHISLILMISFITFKYVSRFIPNETNMRRRSARLPGRS